MEDPLLDEQVAHVDVMTFLSSMLTDTLSQFDKSGEGEKLTQGNCMATGDVEEASAGFLERGWEEGKEKQEGINTAAEDLKGKQADAKKQQIMDVLCQGIHLLKAMRY